MIREVEESLPQLETCRSQALDGDFFLLKNVIIRGSYSEDFKRCSLMGCQRVVAELHRIDTPLEENLSGDSTSQSLEVECMEVVLR